MAVSSVPRTQNLSGSHHMDRFALEHRAREMNDVAAELRAWLHFSYAPDDIHDRTCGDGLLELEAELQPSACPERVTFWATTPIISAVK